MVTFCVESAVPPWATVGSLRVLSHTGQRHAYVGELVTLGFVIN